MPRVRAVSSTTFEHLPNGRHRAYVERALAATVEQGFSVAIEDAATLAYLADALGSAASTPRGAAAADAARKATHLHSAGRSSGGNVSTSAPDPGGSDTEVLGL